MLSENLSRPAALRGPGLDTPAPPVLPTQSLTDVSSPAFAPVLLRLGWAVGSLGPGDLGCEVFGGSTKERAAWSPPESTFNLIDLSLYYSA